MTVRIHHLLSDIAHGTFLIYDVRDDVRDIREQFPLNLDQTPGIADAAGIRYPVDSRSRVDLLVDPAHGGKIVTIARTIKPSET